MAFGTAVPDARLLVSLSESIPNRELLTRLDRTMRSAGYLSRRGKDPEVFDTPQKEGTRHGWDWHPTDGSTYTDRNYYISVYWNETGVPPNEFEFMFRNGGTDPFTAIEWIVFYEWKDDWLRSEFPEATITITRHPAESTDFKFLPEISAETGFAIPEKVQLRYKEWSESEGAN